MSDVVLQAAAGVALVGLALLARWVTGRWVYPAVVFCGTWGGSLLAGLALPFGDLRLSSASLLAFTVGGCAFAAAAIATTAGVERGSPSRAGPPATPRAADAGAARATRVVVVISSVVLLLLVPRFTQTLREAAAMLSIEDLAVGARTVLSGQFGSLVPRGFGSASSVGLTLAFLLSAVYDGSRPDRALLAVGVAAPLAMLALTFARTPVFTLVIGVLGILAFRRRLPLAVAGVVFLVALAGAIAMGAALGKGPDTAATGSQTEAVARSIGMYFVGGPLGFSAVMERPVSVGEPGLSYRFVTQALQSLGASVVLPDNVLGYARTELGNVYTYYFAYWLDFGWAGVVGAGMASGAVSTLTYEGARRGSLFCLGGLGIVYPALVNSTTGDGIFGSSIPWLLLAALVVALHGLAATARALPRLARHPRIARLADVR